MAWDNVFAAIAERDMCCIIRSNHSYRLSNSCARRLTDPDVIVIKQTLYRTGPDSPVAEALVEAARAGKEVTVVVEFKARFDERANIDLAAKTLQEAGAHVVYGVVGHKTHAKMILVVRREGKLLRRYVHLGTGNYHPSTARLYTDYGLFTCDNAFGVDVQKIFHQLTAPGRPGKLKKMLAVPVHAAQGDDRVHRTRSRVCARRQTRADHRENECAGRSPGDQGAVRSIARGR